MCQKTRYCVCLSAALSLVLSLTHRAEAGLISVDFQATGVPIGVGLSQTQPLPTVRSARPTHGTIWPSPHFPRL